jgi:hypothetical protein
LTLTPPVASLKAFYERIALALYISSFPPLFSFGTASGEFPRPAASRRLLFRLLPRNLLEPAEDLLVALPKSRRSLWEWSPLAFGRLK